MIEVEIEQMKEVVSKYGYDYEKFIGLGPSSSVSLCRGKVCLQQFAIKRSNKQISDEEYNTLISLSHPNILSLYNVFNDDDYQYLVMEYCSKGTIAQQGKLPPEKFIFYAKQMLNALIYCHEKQVSHLNIKPENILIDQYNHIKLGDFGATQQLDEFKDKKKSKENFEQMVFLAPEVLQHKKFDPFQADIWALGVTFYYMAVGHYPFIRKTKDETKKAIVYCELDFGDAKIDPQIRFLINKMISKNDRLTARKLLKLPVFTSNKFAKKINLIGSVGRRNSLTHGLNGSGIFVLSKSMTFEDCTDESASEDKNTNPLLDVHCYQSVAIHPNVQMFCNHHQNAIPN